MSIDALSERFWVKAEIGGPDDCWPWLACKKAAGYGRISARVALGGPAIWDAHRVAWTLANGPIPAGAELDHLCHTRDTSCIQGDDCPHRACINPAHLEPVTHQENAVRREARLTRFKCGHPYSERIGNGGNSGRCGVCAREADRVRRHARAALRKAS